MAMWSEAYCNVVGSVLSTEFVITIEPHAEPAMLEEIAGSLVHDLIRVNVFDSCCREWLWATPWTGLRPSYQVSQRCLGSDSSTGHTLVSPNGRPGLEARDRLV